MDSYETPDSIVSDAEVTLDARAKAIILDGK